MGLRPTREDEKTPSVQQPLSTKALRSPLSSRPERTRISCFAAPDRATCAAFIKESRMKLISATNVHRKFGVA